MPTQAYRASTASAGEHIAANRRLWILGSAALTAVFAALYWMSPDLKIWAHLLTLSGMVCGVLVMIQSQVDYVSPYAPNDSEEEDFTPPSPRA